MKNKEKVNGKRAKKRRKVVKNRTSIKTLVKKITELNEFLPSINDPIDKTSMKYLASLYSEAIILVRNITAYMVQNGYCGMHDSIDDTVLKTQELVGILKEFEKLDTSEGFYDFDEISQNKASSLLKSLKVKMGELVALKTSTAE
jgi:hypothetical protein